MYSIHNMHNMHGFAFLYLGDTCEYTSVKALGFDQLMAPRASTRLDVNKQLLPPRTRTCCEEKMLWHVFRVVLTHLLTNAGITDSQKYEAYIGGLF